MINDGNDEFFNLLELRMVDKHKNLRVEDFWIIDVLVML